MCDTLQCVWYIAVYIAVYMWYIAVYVWCIAVYVWYIAVYVWYIAVCVVHCMQNDHASRFDVRFTHTSQIDCTVRICCK